MPATVSRLLGDVKGDGLVTLFTAGACGDVNHIDVKWAERQSGTENAARMGVILSAAVLRELPRLKPAQDGPLVCERRLVPLPLPAVSEADRKASEQVLQRLRSKAAPPPTFMEMVQAVKVADVARQGKPLDAEVQVVALGQDLAFVSLPGEVFVELGLAVKQDSPFALTAVAELANGSVGYVPSRRAYAQGNYEVVSARCAEGSGEMLVSAAVELLHRAYRRK
jgi:hypothetical protein